jgi:hypothetical protein
MSEIDGSDDEVGVNVSRSYSHSVGEEADEGKKVDLPKEATALTARIKY